MNQLQPDRLIDGREADKITGTSRSRRYQLMKCGEYPQPVKLGNCTRYSERELLQWVQRRVDERANNNKRERTQ